MTRPSRISLSFSRARPHSLACSIINPIQFDIATNYAAAETLGRSLLQFVVT